MIASIPLSLKSYTERSASYLDLHLEIDSEGRLRTKLYDKKDAFNCPNVNFPFICSNIPPANWRGYSWRQLELSPDFQSLPTQNIYIEKLAGRDWKKEEL